MNASFQFEFDGEQRVILIDINEFCASKTFFLNACMIDDTNPIWYFFHLSPRQNIFLNDKAEFVLNSHELFFDFLIWKQGKIGKFKLVWTGNSIIRGYRYFANICIKFVQIDFLQNAYYSLRMHISDGVALVAIL